MLRPPLQVCCIARLQGIAEFWAQGNAVRSVRWHFGRPHAAVCSLVQSAGYAGPHKAHDILSQSPSLVAEDVLYLQPHSTTGELSFARSAGRPNAHSISTITLGSLPRYVQIVINMQKAYFSAHSQITKPLQWHTFTRLQGTIWQIAGQSLLSLSPTLLE